MVREDGKINIAALRYVRLGTADIDGAIGFATDILGLELVGREANRAYLRGDDRDHNICYVAGDPRDHTVGFELASMSDLDDAEQRLTGAGVAVRRGSVEECTERRVLAFLSFREPSGTLFDLTVRPFHSGKRFFPSRDVQITEFSHIGLRTTDAARDEAFWTALFNIRPNDWIGAAPLLSFDRMHHRMALFPSDRGGVQHVNFQVRSIDDIMQAHYFLTERQVKIVFGPGRHPTSSAMFIYFEGPDGMVYEYSSGVRMIDDPDYRPRQFPMDARSFCMWGAVPDIPEFRAARKAG